MRQQNFEKQYNIVYEKERQIKIFDSFFEVKKFIF